MSIVKTRLETLLAETLGHTDCDFTTSGLGRRTNPSAAVVHKNHETPRAIQ